MNLPYMQLFVNDWISDAALQRCELATRGVWVQLICAMWQQGQTGEISGTARELSRICSCDRSEIVAALEELARTGAADIEKVGEVDVVYSVTCRRMRRDWKRGNGKREAARLRKQRQRAGESRPLARASHAGLSVVKSSAEEVCDEVSPHNTESRLYMDPDQTGRESEPEKAGCVPGRAEAVNRQQVYEFAESAGREFRERDSRGRSITRKRSDRLLILTAGHLVATGKVPQDVWREIFRVSVTKQNPASYLSAAINSELGGGACLRRWLGAVSRAVPEKVLRSR